MITSINITKTDNWEAVFTFDERGAFTFGSADTLEDFLDGVKEIVTEYRKTGLKVDPLEEAKDAIIRYCMGEFDLMFREDVDMSDLSHIAIGYTTSEDGKHDIQWYADLTRCRLFAEIDGEEACTEWYPSLLEMARVFSNEDDDFIFADLMGMAENWIEEKEA